MSEINFKKNVHGSLEEILTKVESVMKTVGFGVLTEINFHQKIREKIGKEIKPVIILGFCNPTLAYEAYLKNPDVTSLLPCNVVVREVGDKQFSVEIAKPTTMMKVLGDEELVSLAREADTKLQNALHQI